MITCSRCQSRPPRRWEPSEFGCRTFGPARHSHGRRRRPLRISGSSAHASRRGFRNRACSGHGRILVPRALAALAHERRVARKMGAVAIHRARLVAPRFSFRRRRRNSAAAPARNSLRRRIPRTIPSAAIVTSGKKRHSRRLPGLGDPGASPFLADQHLHLATSENLVARSGRSQGRRNSNRGEHSRRVSARAAEFRTPVGPRTSKLSRYSVTHPVPTPCTKSRTPCKQSAPLAARESPCASSPSVAAPPKCAQKSKVASPEAAPKSKFSEWFRPKKYSPASPPPTFNSSSAARSPSAQHRARRHRLRLAYRRLSGSRRRHTDGRSGPVSRPLS